MASHSGHVARKRFGQNFLVDQNIIAKIIDRINPKQTQTIIEIGPGQGALTEPLLASGAQLLVLEIDRDLAEQLRQRHASTRNFSLQEGDALKFDFERLDEPNTVRVVGNLPYNISTPLIFHMLRHKHRIKDMVFMLQNEVVERMAAEPGGKDYGRLSVMTQYHCDVQRLLHVPPTAFRPAPKVQSAIVGLVPKSTPSAEAGLDEAFARVVKAAFSARRKTLRNTLREVLDIKQIEACNVDPGSRAERLSVAEFVLLARALDNSGQ